MKPWGLGMGRVQGEAGALEEAGTVTNKAAWPSQMSREEEEGVGRGREREEEVRALVPRARGHSNACRWNAKARGEKWYLAAWEHGTERAGSTNPGKALRGRRTAKLLRLSIPTPAA